MILFIYIYTYTQVLQLLQKAHIEIPCGFHGRLIEAVPHNTLTRSHTRGWKGVREGMREGSGKGERERAWVRGSERGRERGRELEREREEEKEEGGDREKNLNGREKEEKILKCVCDTQGEGGRERRRGEGRERQRDSETARQEDREREREQGRERENERGKERESDIKVNASVCVWVRAMWCACVCMR